MMRALAFVILLLGAIVAVGAWLGLRHDRADAGPAPRLAATLTEPAMRGAYLATAGNCRGCHTTVGGAPYAGGRAIPTHFGTFYAPNITPDPATGLGAWSEEDFWLALHEGRGRGGRLLYPTFPYTHYTKLSREDSDALHAHLQTVPAVAQVNRAHELRFPYDQRWLLIAWRALFFRPGGFEADAARDASWNRGAYLVQGVAHCGACHEARNSLGAIQSRDNPAGGVVLDWYAPALDARNEAGVAHWTQEDVVAILRDGAANGATVSGPMAEVVGQSLQHLRDEDLQAMAAYLRAVPDKAARVREAGESPEDLATRERGARLYADHCASCHGDQGEGGGIAAPALAGNRAVTMASAANPIRMVLYGGFAPGTPGNPRPFGMPPFHGTLTDREIADVVSYARASWGNSAPGVVDFEVRRQRTGPLW